MVTQSNHSFSKKKEAQTISLNLWSGSPVCKYLLLFLLHVDKENKIHWSLSSSVNSCLIDLQIVSLLQRNYWQQVFEKHQLKWLNKKSEDYIDGKRKYNSTLQKFSTIWNMNKGKWKIRYIVWYIMNILSEVPFIILFHLIVDCIVTGPFTEGIYHRLINN